MKVILFLLLPVIIFSQGLDSTNVAPEYEENKWSFGLVYVPYFAGEYFYHVRQTYSGTGIIYLSGPIESVFESQFSYSVYPKVRIILDFGYSSTSLETRYERQDNYNSYGYENLDEMQIFIINLGIKYYFHELFTENISAYLQGSIGKQFAFVDSKFKNLYPNPYNQSSYSNNENEFMEDINSPFLLTIGFGTEYFFNKSLSLHSNFRLVYSTFSGEYESREEYLSSFEYIQEKTEYTELIKQVGLGLNFYF